MKESTSSPAATHANHSALPGSAEARKMTATSGRKCAELLHKQNPLGSFVKMFMVTSQWASTKCWLTWKAKGTPRNRLLFQLAPKTHRTGGTEYGLLPTPTASDFLIPASAQLKKVAKNNRGERQSKMGTSIAWCDTFLEEHRMTGGELSPKWIEVVMGYPIGWTDLNPSETP